MSLTRLFAVAGVLLAASAFPVAADDCSLACGSPDPALLSALLLRAQACQVRCLASGGSTACLSACDSALTKARNSYRKQITACQSTCLTDGGDTPCTTQCKNGYGHELVPVVSSTAATQCGDGCNAQATADQARCATAPNPAACTALVASARAYCLEDCGDVTEGQRPQNLLELAECLGACARCGVPEACPASR